MKTISMETINVQGGFITYGLGDDGELYQLMLKGNLLENDLRGWWVRIPTIVKEQDGRALIV